MKKQKYKCGQRVRVVKSSLSSKEEIEFTGIIEFYDSLLDPYFIRLEKSSTNLNEGQGLSQWLLQVPEYEEVLLKIQEANGDSYKYCWASEYQLTETKEDIKTLEEILYEIRVK